MPLLLVYTFMKKIITEVVPNGHCATICQHQEGLLLAYYNGPECTDSQSVHVDYYEKNKKIATIRLPKKTGNMVLIPMNKKEACLIFSLFNDDDGISKPRSPVERWRFCTNWKCIISYIGGQITISTPERFETEYNVGHLVRCNPIFWKNLWFLPIYREHNIYGEILISTNGYNWTYRSKIGDSFKTVGRMGSGVLIQPTIWADDKHMYSLSRDVSNNKKAWYSWSTNEGKDWSIPEPSKISNDNNSIVAIHMNITEPLLVWNLDMGRGTLVIGKFKTDGSVGAKPIEKLNSGGNASYPNYCFDQSGDLNVVYTNSGSIVRHIIDRRMVDKFLI
jgi:predicted neuraminidase